MQGAGSEGREKGEGALVTITITNVFPLSGGQTGPRGVRFSVQGHTAGVWAQGFLLHSLALNHEPEGGMWARGTRVDFSQPGTVQGPASFRPRCEVTGLGLAVTTSG